MILDNKYDYRVLERKLHNGVRHYRDPTTNDLLPSVTTILSATADKSGINSWRDSIGHEKADKIVESSSKLGHQVHTNIEKYLLKNESPSGSIMAKIISKMIIEQGLSKVNKIYGCEVSLYHPLYGGTCDLVAEYNNKIAILDFKNARSERTLDIVHDYFLQIAAYALAHDYMYNTHIELGVIMLGTQTGKYQEFVIEKEELDKLKVEWIERVEDYYLQYL